jgi:hypothetical protein
MQFVLRDGKLLVIHISDGLSRIEGCVGHFFLPHHLEAGGG